MTDGDGVGDPLYLNNAATTYPKPESVLRVLHEVSERPPENPHRGGAAHGRHTVEEVRRRLAEYLGVCDPHEVAFTGGATAALNLVICGLTHPARRTRNHIVTTVVEHNSVLRPLYRLRRESDISLTFARCDAEGRVPVEEIARCVRDDTLAVVVNHGSNVTGAVNDIGAIAEVAHARGARVVVDAAQTAGHVPINFDADSIDALVVAGHKALFGIAGVGAAVVRRDLPLRPVAVGGTGSRSDLDHQPEAPPVRYEAGTLPLPAIATLGAGVDTIRGFGEKGDQAIADEGSIGRTIADAAIVDQLVEAAVCGLRSIPGVTVFAAEAPPRTPVVSFLVEGLRSEEVAMVLGQSFRITVRAGLHCAPLVHKELGTFPDGAVRASYSHLSPRDATDRLLAAVAAVARTVR